MTWQPGFFDDESPTSAGVEPTADGKAPATVDEYRESLQAQHAEAQRIAARIPSNVHFGTSSWSFPGWAGLVYGGHRTPSSVARDGLREYATHPLLTTVGIDRSYYAPVPLDDLRRYADQLPDGFRCCLKAPGIVTSVVVPGHRLERNPHYLSASRFIEDLIEPCAAAFAGHTGPFVVEFPPAPREARPEPGEFAERLDALLASLPAEFTYAIELRDRTLLTPEYARVLARSGASHTYNYWSAMPLPGTQAATIDPATLTASSVVVRLLLRPGTRYADQRQAFRPFNRLVEPDPAMRSDTIDLIERAVGVGKRVFVLVNNKAEGSAPLTIMALGRQLAGKRA